jgi:hypothetical protein
MRFFSRSMPVDIERRRAFYRRESPRNSICRGRDQSRHKERPNDTGRFEADRLGYPWPFTGIKLFFGQSFAVETSCE